MSLFVEVVLRGQHRIDYPKKHRANAVYSLHSVLPGGQSIELIRGHVEDVHNYELYLRQCKHWLQEDGVGPVPTFTRQHGRFASCDAPDQFGARVMFAAARIREQGRVHERDVDTCFEMGDGDTVVYAIMQMAKTDPFLRRGIEALGSRTWEEWKKTEKSGGGLPLLSACCS